MSKEELGLLCIVVGSILVGVSLVLFLLKYRH